MILLILAPLILLLIHIILYPSKGPTKILSVKNVNTIGKIVEYSGNIPPSQKEIEDYEKRT